MFKIPNETKKYSQTNQSDLFGNIWYTKNINFDEEGYIKLSPRCISIYNELSNADFGLPLSFGRYSTGNFYIPTTDNSFILDASDTTLSTTIDDGSNVPSLSVDSYGIWWRNAYHVSTSTKIFSKSPSTGSWTERITGLTSGVAHPLCDFARSGSLLIGNGNVVAQYNSSYSASGLAQLTLPTDYEVIGIAYNNNQAGIITRLSDTAEGQNKSAQFFTWDGSEASANYGYDVESDACISLVPYKSSFAILTRTGELKYFNGGGFEPLASFPPYYSDVIWGSMTNKMAYGDSMRTEGDLIYININSTINNTNEVEYLENMMGGIWCYDPSVGLYHRASPSISEASMLKVGQANVDTTNNIMTITSGTIPETGNPVKITDSTIGGLHNGEIYYIIKSSSTQFKLATTKENAIALTSIDLTSQGGANSYFVAFTLKDYGQGKTIRAGGVALFGSKSQTFDDLIFGGEYYKSDATTDKYHLNISIKDFKNIGYFITPKLSSSEVEDVMQKVYSKYRPLKDTDSIILKYKNKEYVGLPEYAECTATSSTVLTTTTYIPYSTALLTNSSFIAEDYELECEVFKGAGSGQMVKVSSITEDAGTYTITLAEELEGVVASDKLAIKLDNWTTIATITNDTQTGDEINETPIAKNSKWTKIKVILSGSNIAIEELLPINKIYKSN